MLLPNKTIKNKKFNYPPKKMSDIKPTQYGGDVVMFLPNKIKKNKKNLNYPQKNVGLAHGLKTICKALLNHVQ